MTRFAALLLACFATTANAAISLSLSANFDLTRTTAYPLGDKPLPQPFCTTWECGPWGDAVGDVRQVSDTELEIAASSANDLDNIVVATQDFPTGDIQVVAQLPAAYTGWLEDFTSFGVICQESEDVGSFFATVRISNGSAPPRFRTGTSVTSSVQTGDTLTARPEYVALTYDDSESLLAGWQSDDGVTYTQIGTSVSRDLAATAKCGVFGTSNEVGQTSFATLTDVVASSVITVFTPAVAPTFTGPPSHGTITSSTIPVSFTTDQSGTVYGVACPDGQSAPTAAQVKNGACTNDVAAVDSFQQAVVADISDGDTLSGLSSLTTYDTHFVASSANGDSAVSSLANQTTLSGGGGGVGTCLSPLASPNNDTINSGIDLTYASPSGQADNNRCRDGNDIVAGWDFSMPVETAVASRGGNFNGPSTFPIYYKGQKLYQCNLRWKDIEATQGVFNWTSAEACFNPIPTGYTGVMLNVRGSVSSIIGCGSKTGPQVTSQWTAPQWVINAAPVVSQGCNANRDLEIFTINLNNDTIRGYYKTFIQTFAARNYKNASNMIQIMHFASGSEGEECCGGITAANVKEIIAAWADNYGSNVWKLAFIKEDPTDVYDYSVNTKGTGVRGGFIENWLRTAYTPGNAGRTGQILTTASDPLGAGHLKIDPAYKPISELRHWADQNESFGAGGNFPNNPTRNYLASALRAMQMRRIAMWIETNSNHNGMLDDWESLEEGKTAATTSDAWAWLMETRAYSGGIVTINNFERHLFQHEGLGATTVTNKLDHGYNPSQNSNLPATSASCNFGGNTNCHAAAWSRRGASIGFALEDSFWSTSLTQDAVFKFTYISTSSNTITLTNSSGSTICTVNAVGSAAVRTATCFVSNFSAPSSGVNKDFSLNSNGTVDFIFVRVIKNGNGYATW